MPGEAVTESVQSRVERGVAALDEKMPGWVAMIDLETLDMSSPEKCVLGQVFADRFLAYIEGLERLGIDREGDDNDKARYGFELYEDQLEDDRDAEAAGVDVGSLYGELTAEWRVVITQRRAPKPSGWVTQNYIDELRRAGM